MDKLSALDAFCRVVEAGSFSAAAAELNVSHTVISKQVRQLETALGAQLLNRTTRKLALTEAGQGYYERARRILDDVQDADLALSAHHATPRGTLRINAPMAFGTLDVARWLPRFMARYPELTIDLVCNDRMLDLIDEGFDVALRLARTLPDSSLSARKLGTSKIIVVASPAYLQKHGMPQTPEDLAQHNCLVYTLASKPSAWTFMLPDGGERSVAVRGSLQANTSVALRESVLAGVGIAAAADFIVADDIARGDLVPLLSDYPMPPRELFAVYPHNRHLSPKVRALIDFAAEIYGGSWRNQSANLRGHGTILLCASAITVGRRAHVVHMHIAFVMNIAEPLAHRGEYGIDVASFFFGGIGFVGHANVDEEAVLALRGEARSADDPVQRIDMADRDRGQLALLVQDLGSQLQQVVGDRLRLFGRRRGG
jgi:DNA-binding transcriptional LysR family regulator